jgi:quercetin dioxygenase-like cupin family protein
MRYAVRRLDEVPTVPGTDVRWHPLQHHFRLSAFGANVFVANSAGDELIAEHDESPSGQEELYVVLRGTVRFVLDGDEFTVEALSVVGVTDPSVRRAALAAEPGATLLALGAERRDEFRSTWRSTWFADVPQA